MSLFFTAEVTALYLLKEKNILKIGFSSLGVIISESKYQHDFFSSGLLLGNQMDYPIINAYCSHAQLDSMCSLLQPNLTSLSLAECAFHQH